MLRIGAVNLDTSHPAAFARHFERGEKARYVAVFDDGFRSDAEVEVFVRRFGLQRRFSRLAGMVEAVDVGFIHACDWDRHLELALPFLERGKPVFIDKPISGNIRHCAELEELSREGRVILGSSSVRYAPEIAAFLAEPESSRGTVVHALGTGGMDEFNYGIHVVEGLGALFSDTTAEAARFVGSSPGAGGSYETSSIRFQDSRTAVYSLLLGTWAPFRFTILTTRGTYQLEIETRDLYSRMLDLVCESLTAGASMLAPVEKLTESVKIMLAARLSRDDQSRGREEVSLASIPMNDAGFDGRLFSREYARSVRPLDLDD